MIDFRLSFNTILLLCVWPDVAPPQAVATNSRITTMAQTNTCPILCEKNQIKGKLPVEAERH
jgi:hypothetical protein